MDVSSPLNSAPPISPAAQRLRRPPAHPTPITPRQCLYLPDVLTMLVDVSVSGAAPQPAGSPQVCKSPGTAQQSAWAPSEVGSIGALRPAAALDVQWLRPLIRDTLWARAGRQVLAWVPWPVLIHPCRGDPSSPKSHLQSPACRARQRSRFLFGSSGWPFLSTGCPVSCSSSCFIFFSLPLPLLC